MNFHMNIQLNGDAFIEVVVDADGRNTVLAHADNKGWEGISITTTQTDDLIDEELQETLDTNW